MEPVFAPIAATVKLWMAAMGWQRSVTGAEHIPASGPAVVASNHIGYLDPLFLGWVIEQRGRVPRYLAKRELFDNPVLAPLLRSLRQVPVDRAGNRGLSIQQGVRLLGDGEVLVVFPEATISTSFVPAEDPKTGAARLALASGAPLIPVGLWGTQRLLTKHRPRNLQRGVALVARVGAPVPYSADEDPEVVTARLWARVRELVDVAQRTYPQQPDGPDDRWWLPRHLGGTAPSVAEATALRRREEAQRRARREQGERQPDG